MIEAMIERCAGIDVGKKFVLVCVMTGGARDGPRTQIKQFGTIVSELDRLAAWLVPEGYSVQARRGWGRLDEKGGKEHAMPTHHNLDRDLDEYIQAVGLAEDRKGPLFRTARGRTGELTAMPCSSPISSG